MSTLEQHTIVIPTCNERDNLALQAHAVVSQQAGDAAARFRGYRRARVSAVSRLFSLPVHQSRLPRTFTETRLTQPCSPRLHDKVQPGDVQNRCLATPD